MPGMRVKEVKPREMCPCLFGMSELASWLGPSAACLWHLNLWWVLIGSPWEVWQWFLHYWWILGLWGWQGRKLRRGWNGGPQQNCSWDSSLLVYMQSGEDLWVSPPPPSAFPWAQWVRLRHLGGLHSVFSISVHICFWKGRKMGLLLFLCSGTRASGSIWVLEESGKAGPQLLAEAEVQGRQAAMPPTASGAGRLASLVQRRAEELTRRPKTERRAQLLRFAAGCGPWFQPHSCWNLRLGVESGMVWGLASVPSAREIPPYCVLRLSLNHPNFKTMLKEDLLLNINCHW